MGIGRGRKSNKNPPFLSHEFIIQNHADAVSCVMMVFVIGLMFQATSPYASTFIALQHPIATNVTEGAHQDQPTFYQYGLKDICTTFFYFMLCIVIHAVLQEYVLDKMNRRMHLSKVKHGKFNESGQLMVFYLVSAIWGANIIYTEAYATNIASLWEGYPSAHVSLSFMAKFFYIIQIAYWLHAYPDLYFMKVKRDEMYPKIIYISLHLAFITAAYLLSFTRVALFMLAVHYAVEFIFHASRLLYFAEKTDIASSGFMIWNVLFVLVRLATITFSVLTFWYGLAKSSVAQINIETGNFNTSIIRINCLAGVCLLQAWMMWNYITFHLKRMRERTALTSSKKSVSPKRSSKDKKGKAKKDDDALVNDQDTNNVSENGAVRNRGAKKKN